MRKGIHPQGLLLTLSVSMSLLAPLGARHVPAPANTDMAPLHMADRIEEKPTPVVMLTPPAPEQPYTITPPKPTQPTAVAVHTGTASWYGSDSSRERLATGGRYTPTQLTAAHRRLPFGTYVRVTNLANKRSTVVRINDRGPYIKGRILDLNVAAARELAMMQSGVAKIRMEVLPSKPGQEG